MFRYIPNTREDQAKMLSAIGVDSIGGAVFRYPGGYQAEQGHGSASRDVRA